jgi:hypothetical protein
MAKGDRANLEHLLRSAWERQVAMQANHTNLQQRSVVESTDPSREWKQPLNRADSIGLSGVLVGIFFVLIIPTVWYKVPAFVLVCFGFVAYGTHAFRIEVQCKHPRNCVSRRGSLRN